MPRRSILTATERKNLLGWPESQAELIRHYTLSATDLAIIRQHRGAANRLGYAVQLCSMRFLALGVREKPFSPLLQMVAVQLKVPAESWIEACSRRVSARCPYQSSDSSPSQYGITARAFRVSRMSPGRPTKGSCWRPRSSKNTAGSRCCFRRSTI